MPCRMHAIATNTQGDAALVSCAPCRFQLPWPGSCDAWCLPTRRDAMVHLPRLVRRWTQLIAHRPARRFPVRRLASSLRQSTPVRGLVPALRLAPLLALTMVPFEVPVVADTGFIGV